MALQRIIITDICINGTVLKLSQINECGIHELNNRNILDLVLNENDLLQLDIEEHISEVYFSKWAPEPDSNLLIDFWFSTSSIPQWMSVYSKTGAGCIHRIAVTMKLKGSQANCDNFLKKLRSAISTIQWNTVERDDAAALWKRRCSTRSSHQVVGVRCRNALFGYFRTVDCIRLRDDDLWLSDSHVSLALQDCYRNCLDRKIWGNLRIKLLDTTFWERLSSNPEKFSEGQRKKENLLECDFIVMPMFGAQHWRLGIIERAGDFIQGKMVFHVLDSLGGGNSVSRNEENQLYDIFMMYFPEEKSKPGRISTNSPKVPQQPNTKDCACFTIYFGKKFLCSPSDTLSLMKHPPLERDALANWGLKSNDLTFIRRELRTTLYEYIKRGEAVVEYGKS